MSLTNINTKIHVKEQGSKPASNTSLTKMKTMQAGYKSGEASDGRVGNPYKNRVL